MEIAHIQAKLKKYNIIPTKSKGQSFLLDESVIETMVSAAEINKHDLVIEIGPGLGILSEQLAKSAKQVLLIELDAQIVDILKKEFLPRHKNVTLIEGDVLLNDTFQKIITWLKENAAGISPRDQHVAESVPGQGEHDSKNQDTGLHRLDHTYKIVANLPYQITSKILRQFLESHPQPSSMTIMVQKEVAERITAKPGKMSLISLAVQTNSQAEIITNVPAKSFYPQPKVDSAVIKADLAQPNEKYQKLSKEKQELFWKLAKLGFSARRKQLQKNLKSLGKDADLKEAFQKLKLLPTVRAQELSVDQWSDLSNLVKE